MIAGIRSLFSEVHFKFIGKYQRFTFKSCLKHIKRLNFQPGTVIDVGAAFGTFELYDTFKDSAHFLLEPLEEYKPFLEKIKKSYSNLDYEIAALAEKNGEITMNVHPDLTGSSLYLENEDSDVNGEPRTVKVYSLDSLCEQRNLKGPFLLKVDVQGAEIDVLSGASKMLNDTELVILETTMFQTFKNGPQVFDVIDYMKKRGFVVYDIFGNTYRLLDGALNQVDIAFVKENGIFRKHHEYATREQRAAKNERMKITRGIRKIFNPKW